MSILDPSGPAAHAQFRVWWAMLAVSVAVSLVLFSLWLYTFRRRPQPRRTAWQEQRIMLRWVLGGGVLLPVVSIVALLLLGAPTGRGMLPLPLPGGEEVELIEVVGHQWWWEVRYPGDEDQNDVVTANHLVMPAGEPVDFRLISADVIHAFWIPRLGGKRDMVPGRHSTIRLEADAPGVFGAQCAEFCGAQHTNMLLQVEAVERDEFDAWLAERRTPPEQVEDHDQAREAFGEHCASCHRVEGLPDEFAVGGREYDMEGPDLSDIGSRPTLGAGVLPMEEGAIAYWLQHHQTLKPGNRMPPHDHIDIETLENIGAWLETLEP
ncbi:cytochrome c oxidase subunit II [Billgrantia endophytica]|uniref:Cytochrome aa3 subunit 2 n=2 Tax=Billgrantia endophytica TaxID=2033802 RepID=A0A2N7U8H0_9GAMM|nr:cytochrome c oxidase subunit II [Halomonas endophytica]